MHLKIIQILKNLKQKNPKKNLLIMKLREVPEVEKKI